MKILFDIVHPADVLFFKCPVDILMARGDDVLILSRFKDIACGLLDEFGFPHKPVSRARTHIFGLAYELIQRDLAIAKLARKFRPDVMCGFGGTAISHVGKLLNIPSISFYDSENATLQNRLTWPFIGQLYVPQAYRGPTPSGRTIQLAGTKELSYLHPDRFFPDRDLACQVGLEADIDNFFIRAVGWHANHDVGKSGWSPNTLNRIVEKLRELGRVHISSELPLPENLTQFQYQGSVSQVHHLLGHCRLLVSESATMASEAAILGVPSIYNGRDFPGYVRELGETGLIVNLPASDDAKGLPALEALIDQQFAMSPTQAHAARDHYVAGCPDWAQAVVTAIDTTKQAEKNQSKDKF